MFTLGELVELLRKALKVYEGIAEDNGKSGDLDMYDIMMLEHKLISDFCTKLEDDYKQHQAIYKIQLHTLLSEEGETIYKAINDIIEVYNNDLGYQIEKIREEQSKLECIKGVIESI